jgi:thiamine-phosphate pyrophosphorylase
MTDVCYLSLMPHYWSLPRLMLVTDGRAMADPEASERLAAAVRGGVGIVQLRDPGATASELLERARQLRARLPETLLLINGRVDVAVAAGADGIQLGAGALPLRDARRRLGEHAFIGRSVHSVAEAVAAETEGAQFLVVGTIYPTDTHPGKLPEGPELLEAVAARVRIPLYAIGGIRAENAAECIRCGAYGVAVIRAIGEAVDPEAAARRLLAAIDGALRSSEAGDDRSDDQRRPASGGAGADAGAVSGSAAAGAADGGGRAERDNRGPKPAG